MNSVARCLSQSGIGDNVPRRTYWKSEEAVERLEIKTDKVTRRVGGGEKKLLVRGCNGKSMRLESMKVKPEEDTATLATGKNCPKGEINLQTVTFCFRPVRLLGPFSLPHQTHEFNTADMNASKLENLSIQLNHVANLTDMTAAFLFASLITTEPNETSS